MLRKAIISTVEPIAYVILFLLTIRRIIGGGLISLEEQPFKKTIHEMVLWILLIFIFLWIANRKFNIRQMQSAWGKNWFLLIFILFALFSIVWSTNIVTSIYKGIGLFGCSVIAAYTGLAYKGNLLFRGFWWLFIFLAAVTFAVALLFPLAGTHIGYPYYGAWRGIFWSKNYMGPIMAIGNLVFLFNIASSGKKIMSLLVNTLFYFLTALLVILSKCATAMILFVIINLGFLLVVAWVKWKKHLRRIHYIALTIVCSVVLILVFLNLDFFFGLLNRNTTLTGRLPLWSFLIQNGLSNHPVLGYGYGATWESNNFRFTTQNAVGWDLPPLVSDNGYIDIFLHLGLVGISLLIITVVLCLFRVAKHALKEQTVVSFFPFLLMILIITVNMSLSFYLELESFVWFLMVFALFSTTPLLLENKFAG
jgi:O-antigen ligase